MVGKVDPLFANHPEVLAMEKQTREFMDGLRRDMRHPAADTDLLDRLHQKENEIARLTTALLQIAREGECTYARRIALSALTTADGGGK